MCQKNSVDVSKEGRAEEKMPVECVTDMAGGQERSDNP